jgi:Tfp pilus assembly protein PilO
MDHHFRKKVWLGLGILVASIAVLGGMLFWLAGKVKKDSEKAALTRAAIESYSRAVAILAELKSRAAEVDALSRKLNALLPTKDDLIELPKFLEDQGRISGVGVTLSFSGGSATEPQADRPGSIGFSLDARGETERLRSFFRELETNSAKFIVVLDSLDVNLSGGEYRATAQGRAFFK